MTAIQRFALHGTIMNPHSHGPYVRHEDHLAAMQGRCLAQIEEPAKPARIVLDDCWKARMLDGRAPERDEMGLGNHPELPSLDEGMMPRSFFAALGLELTHTSAEDQLDGDVLGAMSEAVNWADWQPTAPQGKGWKLVSIFDTEDGPVAWWLRELPEAEDGTTTIRNLQAEVEKLKARIARAGAAPAAVAPQDVVAWMHPETLNVISAAHKHDMSTEYGPETRSKADSHSIALVRAEQPAAVAGPAWDKTRDSLATLLLGLARRPFLDFDVACIALDAATEPGMPLAYMRGAPAAPALEAPAAPMSTAEASAALAINSALHRIRAGNAAGAIEPLEQARAALAAAHHAPAEAQEPAANLHDDGYWTPTKTEAGRALNERLMRAGSPRIPVYTHPAPQAPAAPDDVLCYIRPGATLPERNGYEVCRSTDAGAMAVMGDGRVEAPAAPSIPQWIDDPHDIEQGQMLNPAWVKAQAASPAPVAPAATMFHDAGAIAQCTCGRYTLDRNSLSPRDDRRPVCECGTNHGWSGSFRKPGADSKWHGPAPAPEAAPAAPAVDASAQVARDAGFNHGVCLALQIMASAGNAGDAEWTELLDCAGREEIMHYARHVETESWLLCGFAAIAAQAAARGA